MNGLEGVIEEQWRSGVRSQLEDLLVWLISAVKKGFDQWMEYVKTAETDGT